MGQFQDRSLLLEECPRRRGGCRAGARPCAPECQWHRRRRRRGGCCSGARQPCGAAVPGSRGPSPGTPSWRRLVRMQPRRHDGSIGLWNNPCNVKMSGVAYCSILPVCATSGARQPLRGMTIFLRRNQASGLMRITGGIKSSSKKGKADSIRWSVFFCWSSLGSMI